MNEGRTTPPPLLTEAELVKRMDEAGIGTDATIVEHISTIQSRKYAYKDNSSHMIPLPLGLGLVNGFERMGFDFAKPMLRAETEQSMRAIADGTKAFEEERRRFVGTYEELYYQVVRQASVLDQVMKEELDRRGPAPRDDADDGRSGGGGGRGRGRGGRGAARGGRGAARGGRGRGH
jgi:DNA topoisomerase-3